MRMQSEAAFGKIRDALVQRVVDLGFMSALNKVGIMLYGTVRASAAVAEGMPGRRWLALARSGGGGRRRRAQHQRAARPTALLAAACTTGLCCRPVVSTLGTCVAHARRLMPAKSLAEGEQGL
jgi:hypothetical protein